MAGVYTEETLQLLKKTQLIKVFVETEEQTSNTINTLTKEIKENYVIAASKSVSQKTL